MRFSFRSGCVPTVLTRIGFRWPSPSCSQNFDRPAPRAKSSSAVRSIFRRTGLTPVGPAGATIARMVQRSIFIAQSSIFIGARSNHRTRLRVQVTARVTTSDSPVELRPNHSDRLFKALYACGHVGCQPDSVRVFLASKNPNRHVRGRMFFIPCCADRVVADLPLRPHLNREQSFCRLLRESAVCQGQGRDRGRGNHGTDRR